MDGSIILKLTNTTEACPGLAFPGTAEGLATLIAWAKVVLGVMTPERFVEVLVELGHPAIIIERLALYAFTCAGVS